MKKIFIIISLISGMNINTLLSLELYKGENAISSGTGGAYTAGENTTQCLFYNPANFSSITKNYVSLSYNKYFSNLSSEVNLSTDEGYYPVDIYSQSISYIFPAKKIGGIGIFYSYFNFASLRTLSIFGISASTSISRFIHYTIPINFGITGKYIINKYIENNYNESFFKTNPDSVSAIAMDIGISAQPSHSLNIGAYAGNIFSSDIGVKYSDLIPREYRIGIKYQFFVKLLNNSPDKINIFSDFQYENKDYNIFIGSELFLNSFRIRAGLNFNYISFGIGYIYHSLIGINYSLNYLISNLDDTSFNHKINIYFNF